MTLSEIWQAHEHLHHMWEGETLTITGAYKTFRYAGSVCIAVLEEQDELYEVQITTPGFQHELRKVWKRGDLLTAQGKLWRNRAGILRLRADGRPTRQEVAVTPRNATRISD